MVLNFGDKIYVITRRLFEKDLRRHFVGEIIDVDDIAIKASGYEFVFDEGKNDIIRHDELRTRIFPVADAGFIFTIIPGEVNCKSVRFSFNNQQHRIITDGVNFHLNVSEFGINR